MKFIDELFKKEINEINKKHEITAPLVCAGVILIFLMPLLLLLEGINADDCAMQSFPKLMAVARAYQNGEVPLWDKHEFAGAKPFYQMLENPAYNIFHIPFYFLADLDNIDQSFYVLYIIPFALLVIFAGLGAYFLARFYFKFSYMLSILMGFLWAVNPSVALSNYSTTNTLVFACIPWIVLTIGQFLETKKWGWWMAGVFSLALMNTSYTVNYPVRTYFTLGLIFLMLAIWYVINDRKNLSVIGYAVLIPVTGFLMTSFVLAHIIEAAGFCAEQIDLSYGHIINFEPNNMFYTHLITLFIPNFNGSLDNTHAWGDGMLIESQDKTLTGGIFTSFSILLTIVILYYNVKKKLELDKKDKIWLIIGIVVNIFILSVMLQKYTPVYFIMTKILPLIFLVPYPYYFHFAHHFASIILIVFGISLLIKHKVELKNILHPYLAIYYSGFVIVFMIIYMILKTPGINIINFDSLLQFHEVVWFLTNPVLYFIIAYFLLTISYINIKRKFKFFKYLMITAVFLEASYIGYLGFYKNTIMPRAEIRGNEDRLEQFQRPHYKLPGRNPIYSQIGELRKIAQEYDSRWISDVTFPDCISFMVNGRTLSGYDSKPLITEVRSVLENFYHNFGYHLAAYTFPKRLLSNMNVSHLLVYNNLKEENRLYDYSNNGIEYYATRKKETLENLNWYLLTDHYFPNFGGVPFKIYKLEEPMPYIYFQNVIFEAERSIQHDRIMKEDLRKYALMQSGPAADFPMFDLFNIEDYNTKKQFDELQLKNRIIDIDKKYYNRLKVRVQIKESCVMVRNEAFSPDWEVYVNGKKTELFKVNFIQQGVLLSQGEYDISFKYNPKLYLKGVIISAAVFVVCLLIALFFVLKSAFFSGFNKNRQLQRDDS